MKKRLVYCVFMAVVVIAQMAVVPALFHGGPVPSVLFMLVLAWSLADGFIPFLPWTVGLGIVADSLLPSPMGLHVIFFTLLAYGASFLSRRFLSGISGGGIVFMSFLVFLGTLAARSLRMAILLCSGDSFKNSINVFFQPGTIFLEFGVNLFIFFGLLFLIKKTKKFFWIE